MKRIGLLGGMSWESTLEYYRIMNETVKEKLGGTHSADCILYSFNFQKVEELQHKGDWNSLTNLMIEEAHNLKSAGAELIVICTNTMHIMAQAIEESTGLKVIHIADTTADEINRRNIKKVLLLGTRFTMEGSFYRDKLEAKGIEVCIPNEKDRQLVHETIYKELIVGKINDKSRDQYIEIIKKSVEKGVSGVVLGCTEIPLLIKDNDLDIEVLDTMTIHSKASIEYALK